MGVRACVGPRTGERCPTGAVSKNVRCPKCASAYEKARGTSTARGYDHKHRTLSVTARAEAIRLGKHCHFCGRKVRPGERLALDHTPDRTGYRGVVHESCNARDGALRGNANRARGV